MTTKPIVVGTDGSAESLRAVEWATREAALRSAPLRIVSATEILPRMTVPPQAVDIETVAAGIRKNRDWALATAASAAAAMAPDLLIDTDPLDGPPAEAVTHSGSGALMLVVGSRGSNAFTAMVLGSVSRYAALHAPCPVVVVREETMATHRQIVVGIRNPDDCAAALAFAFEEAQLRKAHLLAVHAWQSPRAALPRTADVPPVPDPHAADAQAARELEDLLNDWRDKYPDVDASQDVVHGHPGRVLADLSARVDLVVLGRHGPNGRALPGPARVAHAMLSHAHGPVATVPSA
jgi:nucleotide-binding universal stress UspA family protein